MDDVTIVMWALGLGVPLLFGLIIGIIVIAGRPRLQEGLGPRASATGGYAPDGAWNALIFGDGPIGAMGGTLNARGGRFHLQQGILSFVPDGQTAPEWSVPCTDIVARAHTAFSIAGVLLWLPGAQLRCDVSQEHINRVSRNSIKSMRQGRYYREFVAALVANGAREG